MKLALIVPLILASQPANISPAATTPAPLSPAQSEQVRCVAALAIVAHQQQDPANNLGDIPLLQKRGAHFAGTVGTALIAHGVRSKEAVRDLFVAGVASFQKAKLPRETVTSCIVLMDKVDPPAPPPSLPICAAMMALAYDDTKLREGMGADARSLATYAAVLDNRARTELRAAGKSDAESDVVIGLARESLKSKIDLAMAKGEEPDLDFDGCFALAKP
jgi:hypothetical protein